MCFSSILFVFEITLIVYHQFCAHLTHPLGVKNQPALGATQEETRLEIVDGKSEIFNLTASCTATGNSATSTSSTAIDALKQTQSNMASKRIKATPTRTRIPKSRKNQVMNHTHSGS